IICVSRNITERKQAEKELRNAKEQLAVLLDAVPGTVSWVSADLRYIGVNKQLAQIFQRPPEYFIGQPLGFLEKKSYFAELMRDFFASSDQELSLELSTPNGQSYLIVGQKYNQNKSAFTVGIDITERKQAEQQLQTATSRLTTLIKNLQAGILVKDESQKIVLINQQFCTMFGLSISPEEMIGQNFDEFPAYCQNIFLDHEKFVQGLNHIIESREVVTNEELYLVDGKIYERDYIPIFVDDNYSGHLWMYRDITERKRAERELLKTQAELQQALEKEKELNELKSRFVTMTSHEFRTPLSTILSSAELLEYYRHQWPLDKQNKHLKRIQSSVKHMTQLLNDVLIIGRAEADQLEFYPTSIDIIQFCQEFLEEIQLSNKAEQSIIFQSECTISIVQLDEKLLRQILTNLLSNAIKYSPDDGVINFNLICHPEEVKFSVQDQGIGIPEADKIHLFESFHRGTNVSNIPGTGLGLAIVKKCVDVYGGSITVETEVGFGTTFFVTLPLK
ncbi:MAG TPA: PAS domain-containing sensor histidine kinase, partial [Allocoleopsis sp.]